MSTIGLRNKNNRRTPPLRTVQRPRIAAPTIPLSELIGTDTRAILNKPRCASRKLAHFTPFALASEARLAGGSNHIRALLVMKPSGIDEKIGTRKISACAAVKGPLVSVLRRAASAGWI